MPIKPRKPIQFWQELKRRRVIRVLVIYAASAFAILEASDIIFPRLHFPDWSVDLVMYILGVGFILTAILSWVYDLTPEGLKVTESKEDYIQQKGDGKPVQSPETKVWKITSYFSILLIIALIVLNVVRGTNQVQNIEELDKSIAILPFENLGQADHAYFADGMTEEITCLLATIKALGVISRKSAIYYANTDKTMKQIGKELGVQYILEGTVRWATTGDGVEKVRITPTLIRVSDDTHIWVDNYDREITDIFKIQSEIAQKVVEQLGLTLLEGEQISLETKPTESLDAYQAYLRGRYFVGQPHFSLESWNRAIDNFQMAVELDTGFALAYGELARTHARFYNLKYDLSDSRLKKSEEAAAKALKFGSAQPGVHLALGYYYLWAFRNQKQALKHLEIAENGMPNNVEILVAKAAIFEPQGRWDEYISSLEKASRLSPRNASIITDLAFGLWLTHQYIDAIDACDQAISVNPEENWTHLYKAYSYWSWQGANKESRDALKLANPKHEFYIWSWYMQEVGEGNFQAALQLLNDTTNKWVSHKLWARPKPLLSAFIYAYLGEQKNAREGYETALKLLEKKVIEHPDDPRYHSSLGVTYAGLGRKNEAIKEGKEAIRLLPMSKDALYGIPYVEDLAIIYTMLGDFDRALDQVEYLFSVPSWISPAYLEMDIRFAPLKSYPKYKDLVTKYAIIND